MKDRGRIPRHRGNEVAARVEPDNALLDDLRQMPPAPDLSRTIMGRLGYMHLAHGAARRRAVGQWARRGMLILAVAAAMTAGVCVQQASLVTRDAIGPTLPEAVHHDLQWNVQQINSAVDAIRGRLTPLSPTPRSADPEPSPPADPPGSDESIERSAAGPGCWV
ncbi:MAG: hypothetical protein ACYTGG_03450 [Planctomycetota bacterium]